MASEQPFDLNEEIRKLLADAKAISDSIKAKPEVRPNDQDEKPPGGYRKSPAEAARDARLKRLITKADRILRRLEDNY
jgi:hypothetical protein